MNFWKENVAPTKWFVGLEQIIAHAKCNFFSMYI